MSRADRRGRRRPSGWTRRLVAPFLPDRPADGPQGHVRDAAGGVRLAGLGRRGAAGRDGRAARRGRAGRRSRCRRRSSRSSPGASRSSSRWACRRRSRASSTRPAPRRPSRAGRTRRCWSAPGCDRARRPRTWCCASWRVRAPRSDRARRRRDGAGAGRHRRRRAQRAGRDRGVVGAACPAVRADAAPGRVRPSRRLARSGR